MVGIVAQRDHAARAASAGAACGPAPGQSRASGGRGLGPPRAPDRDVSCAGVYLAAESASVGSASMSSMETDTVCLVGTHSTFLKSAATVMGM